MIVAIVLVSASRTHNNDSGTDIIQKSTVSSSAVASSSFESLNVVYVEMMTLLGVDIHTIHTTTTTTATAIPITATATVNSKNDDNDDSRSNRDGVGILHHRLRRVCREVIAQVVLTCLGDDDDDNNDLSNHHSATAITGYLDNTKGYYSHQDKGYRSCLLRFMDPHSSGLSSFARAMEAALATGASYLLARLACIDWLASWFIDESTNCLSHFPLINVCRSRFR